MNYVNVKNVDSPYFDPKNVKRLHLHSQLQNSVTGIQNSFGDKGHQCDEYEKGCFVMLVINSTHYMKCYSL